MVTKNPNFIPSPALYVIMSVKWAAARLVREQQKEDWLSQLEPAESKTGGHELRYVLLSV